MWGRMWSSGRSSGGDGDGDPQRERRVSSDGARKRAVRKWTNQGFEPPSRLLRRETEEYDRLHGRSPSSAAGSSSAARGPSGAALLPVERVWSEEPEDRELVAVKQESEEIERRGVVGPEDFVADVDAVAAAIAERSLREEAKRRRHEEELEDLMLKQAVAANLAAKDKDDEWRRIREEQRDKFIDLISSDED